MSLFDRSDGSELSEVEKALIFDSKYANAGYVQYKSENGDIFFLHPSPFLKTTRNEIYHVSDFPPPPEHSFVETSIVDEKTVILNNFGDKWINIKEVEKWKLFDPSPLAARRKILDFMEIIDYFTFPFKGEEQSVHEIAGCSSLFAFSSPPTENVSGGINSAILAREYQWNLFNKSLQMIPPELRKVTSDYYYHISKVEKNIKKEKGEKSEAILRPKKLISDIPIVILDESQKKISQELQENLKIESQVLTAHLLDALLLQPRSTKKIEEMMKDKIYRMREDYFSAGLVSFNQNLDAIPKLAAAYSRLQSNPEIHKEDIDFVTDLWGSMSRKAEKITSSIKTSHILELTGETAKIFLKLLDIYGTDTEITMAEAARELKIDYQDLDLGIDSLQNKGYCIRKMNSFILLDPFKRQMIKKS